MGPDEGEMAIGGRCQSTTVTRNVLLTGRPGAGKSTALAGAIERLRDRGLAVGGMVAPELRAGGERVGFALENVRTGERATLAHVDRETGPTVGRYRVDVEAVDAMVETAIVEVLAELDVLVIDEIAPMQAQSERFREAVPSALDAETPVLATIKLGYREGMAGSIRDRVDVTVCELEADARGGMPSRLVDALAI